MSIQIKEISVGNLADLFSPCAECIYWEAPKRFGLNEHGQPKEQAETISLIKRDWFTKTIKVIGCTGMILYAQREAAGYAQFAPPHLLGAIAEYSNHISPPDPDGMVISCLYIKPEYQRQGLGSVLLHAIVEKLRMEGYPIVQTYARDDSSNNCSGPTEFYLQNGFSVIESRQWEQAAFSLLSLKLID